MALLSEMELDTGICAVAIRSNLFCCSFEWETGTEAQKRIVIAMYMLERILILEPFY